MERPLLPRTGPGPFLLTGCGIVTGETGVKVLLVFFLSVTGMSPLSPYLNLDPRYLVQVRRQPVFIVLNSIPLFVYEVICEDLKNPAVLGSVYWSLELMSS